MARCSRVRTSSSAAPRQSSSPRLRYYQGGPALGTRPVPFPGGSTAQPPGWIGTGKEVSMPGWMPLRGVRVLAFEGAFSLPSGTRLLADLGAEVVRVGRPGGEYGSYIGVIDGIGLNKRSITVDLRTPEGNAVARRLVEKADMVCNNFTPRVMKQFGLDEPALRAIKPDLITLQLSGYGSPGPWQDFQAFGPSTEAAAGMNALMGMPADPPMRVGSGVFADQASGRFTAQALLDALEHRRRTGEGCCLDLSMTECIISLLGASIVYAARTGQAPARTGNRDPLAAPQ